MEDIQYRYRYQQTTGYRVPAVLPGTGTDGLKFSGALRQALNKTRFDHCNLTKTKCPYHQSPITNHQEKYTDGEVPASEARQEVFRFRGAPATTHTARREMLAPHTTRHMSHTIQRQESSSGDSRSSSPGRIHDCVVHPRGQHQQVSHRLAAPVLPRSCHGAPRVVGHLRTAG